MWIQYTQDLYSSPVKIYLSTFQKKRKARCLAATLLFARRASPDAPTASAMEWRGMPGVTDQLEDRCCTWFPEWQDKCPLCPCGALLACTVQYGNHWSISTQLSSYRSSLILWFFLCLAQGRVIAMGSSPVVSWLETTNRLTVTFSSNHCWRTCCWKNSQLLSSGTLLPHLSDPPQRSSELNTFPENVAVFFFAQIIIYHMLITGNKKICGYLDEILH